MKNRCGEYLIMMFFIMILALGMVNSILCRFGLDGSVPSEIMSVGISPTVRDIEKRYNDSFSSLSITRDLFSLIQRTLGKHEVRNFEVIRSDDDVLYFQKNQWPVDDHSLSGISDQIDKLRATASECNSDFMFVQVPYKNPDNVRELKFYAADGTEKAEDELIELLRKKDIEVLDLRNSDNCSQMYRTDHHWTAESAFYSAYAISNHIKEKFNHDLGDIDRFADFDNYDTVIKKDSFLGSLGIKVGRYYVGKDDFVVYKPVYPTDIEMIHYVDEKLDRHDRGDFWQTLIDEKVLDDVEYNNKYASLLYGCDHEVIIKNHRAENDVRVLVVSHSYGRPLVMYLGLYVSEVMYLDPQDERYAGNITEYIRRNHPDVVILAYNDFLNVEDQ